MDTTLSSFLIGSLSNLQVSTIGINKISDMFEFRPDLTSNFGVTRA